MESIFNTGTNLLTWWEFIKVLIVLGVVINIGFKVYSFYKSYNEATLKENKSDIIGISVRLVILVAVIIGLYQSFGSGVPLPVSEAVDIKEHIKNIPNEDPVEVIKQKAADAKPEVLKRMDSSFAKEMKEADDFIKKALENAN